MYAIPLKLEQGLEKLYFLQHMQRECYIYHTSDYSTVPALDAINIVYRDFDSFSVFIYSFFFFFAFKKPHKTSNQTGKKIQPPINRRIKI